MLALSLRHALLTAPALHSIHSRICRMLAAPTPRFVSLRRTGLCPCCAGPGPDIRRRKGVGEPARRDSARTHQHNSPDFQWSASVSVIRWWAAGGLCRLFVRLRRVVEGARRGRLVEDAPAAHTKLPQLRYRTSAIRAKVPWAARLSPGRVPIPVKVPIPLGHD